MHVVGIICEYNPFHFGHLHHIKEVKKMFPDSVLVLALNGYFLQRGEISYLSKEDKTKLALEYGVDLVLEIPVVFGTQSADTFAEKAIEILNAVGVEHLVFGSESNNLNLIMQMAKAQLDDNFDWKVQQLLKAGVNYPTAVSRAISLATTIQEPNDLLGISYAKAILKNKIPIQMHTIQRTNDYHDTQSNANVVSASNIRSKIQKQEDISSLVPKEVCSLLQTYSRDFYFQLLKYRILTDSHLSIYETVDEGIEHRLQKVISSASFLDEFVQMIKTKRYTYNRIHRMILHILLGFTKEENQNLQLDYLHILGFSKMGREYLNRMRKKITLSTKPIPSSSLYQFEKRAAFFYELLTHYPAENFELRCQPIMKTDFSLFDK